MKLKLNQSILTFVPIDNKEPIKLILKNVHIYIVSLEKLVLLSMIRFFMYKVCIKLSSKPARLECSAFAVCFSQASLQAVGDPNVALASLGMAWYYLCYI